LMCHLSVCVCLSFSMMFFFLCAFYWRCDLRGNIL
jgi:hypothetical protein